MMKEYFQSVEQWFADKDKEVIHKCKICDHEYWVKDTELYSDHYVTCPSCSFVWNSNRPTKEVLDQFYKESNAIKMWSEIKNTDKENERQGAKFINIWKYMHDKHIESCLDVGCGNGFFLNHCHVGVDRAGIEPTKEAAKHCEFPVYESYSHFIDSMHGKKSYELITMCGVLEHLPNPLVEVAKYAEHLSYNGRLCFVVPNVESLLVQTLGKKAATFCPQHLWYFSPKTIEALLSKIGLALDFYITIEPETQPVLKKINGFKPYDDIGIKLTHQDITDHSILANRKGYKLIAWFKKEEK
jgi:SAM-dependent methyltransferase